LALRKAGEPLPEILGAGGSSEAAEASALADA
jgi:hypothetical protein